MTASVVDLRARREARTGDAEAQDLCGRVAVALESVVDRLEIIEWRDVCARISRGEPVEIAVRGLGDVAVRLTIEAGEQGRV